MTQPFAMVRAAFGMDAHEIVGRALHAGRRGEDIGDAGVAGMIARERNIEPEQPLARGERHMDAKSGRLVACPQGDEALGFLRDRAQLSRLDLGEPGGEHAGEAQLIHPMKAAAWRYQPARYGGM